MKGHVCMPVESIYTKFGCGDNEANRGCQKATCCTAEVNLFTASSAPSPPGCCCSISNHPLQVTQDSSSTRVITISLVCILGWTQHEFTEEMELRHLVTSVSVLGVTSLRRGHREQRRPAMSLLPLVPTLPSSQGPGRDRGHPAAQPCRTGRCGSPHIFPDLPWFVMSLCRKASDEPWSPRQQITEVQPSHCLLFSGGSKGTWFPHK